MHYQSNFSSNDKNIYIVDTQSMWSIWNYTEHNLNYPDNHNPDRIHVRNKIQNSIRLIHKKKLYTQSKQTSYIYIYSLHNSKLGTISLKLQPQRINNITNQLIFRVPKPKLLLLNQLLHLFEGPLNPWRKGSRV